MKTINDIICTEPFPFTGTQTEARGSGLKQVANYSHLVGLKVFAAGPDGIESGDVVYVIGTEVRTPYAQARTKLPDGRECIFVPKQNVKLVVKANYKQPVGQSDTVSGEKPCRCDGRGTCCSG